MAICNEPKIRNKLIVAIREQLEHRALWMYLLCDEAKKKGLNPEEYAPEAKIHSANRHLSTLVCGTWA